MKKCWCEEYSEATRERRREDYYCINCMLEKNFEQANNKVSLLHKEIQDRLLEKDLSLEEYTELTKKLWKLESKYGGLFKDLIN